MGVNKKAAPKKAVVFVEKKVGGAKNGETRMVRVKKLTNNVPTVDAPAAGLQELLLRPREEGQGFPHPWNRRHRPCRSPQRQARRCPEAAGHWPPARHWTPQAQRLPTEEGEPEVLGRHLYQARRIQGVCPREHQRQVLRQG